MSPEEVKDKLKSTINHIIKGDADAASAEFHDVVAAKMRDRVAPETVAAEPVADETESEDGDSEAEEVVSAPSQE